MSRSHPAQEVAHDDDSSAHLRRSQRVRVGLGCPVDAAPVQERGSVHINFVRYDPAGSDTGTNAHINKEIVVIKNSTGKARILTGRTLRDTAGHVYHFPQTRLRSGHSVTVHTGKGHNRPGQRYWGQGN
jgi:Lamin Tail Domain